METLVELKNYLQYMRQVGIESLALEHNPFLKPAPPQPAVGARQSTQPIPAKKQESAQRQPAPPRSIPNLATLMESVEELASSQDNRALASTVKGADSVALLRHLYQTFEGCLACPLGTTRQHFVFGEGNPNAQLMFVGGGPDKESNQSGRPFVGATGDLLTRIIEAMNLERKDVFIANIVKCMLPDRAPLPDEVAACTPILERQIEAVDPKVIVAMGPAAYCYFMGSEASLVRGRGRFFNWRNYTVMPTYHPAYINRHPRSKREVWGDLQRVMNRLSE